jgi:predicted dehydrogenase
MKIGIFGLGFMGKTHLKAYQRLPQAEVTVLVNDVPPSPTWQGTVYTDPYQALRDPRIEAVDLCLPTHLHADVTVAALDAGKHVLVEKPMALTGDECKRMLAAAVRNRRILMVAQVVRFIPAYVAAASMIDAGELGPIRSAVLRRRAAAPAWGQWFSHKESSGGAVFDLLVHDLDFCIRLFGLPLEISASGYEDLSRGIDCVTATLAYGSIGSVTVTGGWHHPGSYPFSMEYTIVGDRGTVEYNSACGQPVLYREDGEKQPLVVAEGDGFEAELEYFLDCSSNLSQPRLCPPAQSATAVKLASLVAESRDRKGEALPCEL